MIDKIFFDTNLIVYMFDLSEAKKRFKIKSLLKQMIGKSRLIISTQVVNEFINVSTRLIENKKTEKGLVENLHFLNEIFVIAPLNFSTSFNALKLKNKYKFSFWDSLIIPSAIENNCSYLYSEDMQYNQIVDTNLTIVNPFI